MHKVSHRILASSILAVLVAAGVLMNSHKAAAQGPENGLAVRLVNPLPMPVTGSLALSGNPTVTIGAPIPLPVTENVKQPIQVSGGGAVTGPANFVLHTVPAGKRLVVEHFSSEAGMTATTTVNRYVLGIAPDANNPGVTTFGHFVAPASSSPCGTCVAGQVEVVADQPIKMYVDAGNTLVLNVTFSGPVGASAFAFFRVTGYLVDAL